ncbi:CRAL/TRIO domain-containing protein [Skeletonema marinoi]|uniref:CRAL/TRIO domain-containing protein n=1 Tax=Skeletonema marinoi TaxID=267567 RepID=A0AAD8YHH0_9STRA|nr:CRAL/TRIO domain-containing protein [Skeletonema marinoi]
MRENYEKVVVHNLLVLGKGNGRGSSTGYDNGSSTQERDDHTTITANSDEEQLKVIQLMETSLPESTHAERQRFLVDCNGNQTAAIDKLRKYIKWRSDHCDDALREELDSWTYATQMLQKCGAEAVTTLPCIVHVHEQTTRYVQHLPARIDTTLAKPSTYALALAIFLEHLFDRNSNEKITLVIDVRAGQGWANILAIHLIPFMQTSCRLLCDVHPERLESCIIFPMPKVANVIWKAVKPFLHKDTRKKIVLVNGPAGVKDPVPKKMSHLMDEEMIHQLEVKRRSCFST